MYFDRPYENPPPIQGSASTIGIGTQQTNIINSSVLLSHTRAQINDTRGKGLCSTVVT